MFFEHLFAIFNGLEVILQTDLNPREFNSNNLTVAYSSKAATTTVHRKNGGLWRPWYAPIYNVLLPSSPVCSHFP